MSITYDQVLLASPTLSENNSEKIMIELLTKEGWRCYSSAIFPECMGLIMRFLASHAKQPGIVTNEMLALVPVAVFGYHVSHSGIRVKGATFLNGAVVAVFPQEEPATQLLFVDEETATTWSYPNEGFRRLTDSEEEGISPP